MLKEQKLYSLQDVTILPAITTPIESRSECQTLGPSIVGGGDNKFLPIIAAPMAAVLDENNYKEFLEAGVNCIIPRTVPLKTRLELCKTVFCAFGFKEIENEILGNPDMNTAIQYNILIDVANGHMDKQLQLGRELRGRFPLVNLMGGNIANPYTYALYCEAGFNYVRVGIGGGSGCLTSTNTGIGYPMASLLDKIRDIKSFIKKDLQMTKIIADGGIGTYSDVIKCLALGADYVMLGKVLAKTTSACGEVNVKYNTRDWGNFSHSLQAWLNEFSGDNKGLNEVLSEIKTLPGFSLTRKYYGMSTKKAQSDIKSANGEKDGCSLKTSEGKFLEVPIEYTLGGWVENMNDYLRSSMSYTGKRTLEEFCSGSVEVQVISGISSSGINGK